MSIGGLLMKMYQVVAQVIRRANGHTTTIQVPTFFLDPSIQGIRSDAHAERIATKILQAADPNADVHPVALLVEVTE
jgi:hypothetical protein